MADHTAYDRHSPMTWCEIVSDERGCIYIQCRRCLMVGESKYSWLHPPTKVNEESHNTSPNLVTLTNTFLNHIAERHEDLR